MIEEVHEPISRPVHCVVGEAVWILLPLALLRGRGAHCGPPPRCKPYFRVFRGDRPDTTSAVPIKCHMWTKFGFALALGSRRAHVCGSVRRTGHPLPRGTRPGRGMFVASMCVHHRLRRLVFVWFIVLGEDEGCELCGVLLMPSCCMLLFEEFV